LLLRAIEIQNAHAPESVGKYRIHNLFIRRWLIRSARFSLQHYQTTSNMLVFYRI